MKILSTSIISIIFHLILTGQVTQLTNYGTTNSFDPNTNYKTWASVGKTYFFAANGDGVSGVELWKSDGTSAGTVLVKDINAGNGSTQFNNFTAVGDKLFFIAKTAANGVELWKSDGTSAGTVLVKDINTGAGDGLNLSFSNLIVFNNKVIFNARTSQNGEEPWISDGTSTGTTILKDISPGTSGSSPNNFAILKNEIIFVASSDFFGPIEFWKSNGTTSGTTLVKKLTEAGNLASVNSIASNGIIAYFGSSSGSNHKLWSTNGTNSETKVVKNLLDKVDKLLVLPSNIALFTFDGQVEVDDLWVSDGTDAGTKKLYDFNYFLQRTPFSLVEFEGNAYCYGNDTDDAIVLKTDGKEQNTSIVAKFSTSTSAGRRMIIPAKNELLIVGYTDYSTGLELYTTKGTLASTKLVTNINSVDGESSNPTNFDILSNGLIIFKANPVTDKSQLFVYKPTSTSSVDIDIKGCNFLTNTIFSQELSVYNCFESPSQISVKDANGRLLSSFEIIENKSFDTSNYLAGIYFVTISNSKSLKSKTVKVVKF